MALSALTATITASSITRGRLATTKEANTPLECLASLHGRFGLASGILQFMAWPFGEQQSVSKRNIRKSRLLPAEGRFLVWFWGISSEIYLIVNSST